MTGGDPIENELPHDYMISRRFFLSHYLAIPLDGVTWSHLGVGDPNQL